MILKALELKGFKSFPDKTVLTFGQGITAVVGPNGSGKSNISDAVRWVLGEQSAKSLRGSKMENVVFDGTASRRGMGFAEVSLIIDNTSRALACDEDEVRVTRRYYRSGESDYLLNRSAVRLKDIQMLFMDTGLGPDGYSIIGQGQVGDIVSSKSGERREIFEEAAGIAKYRYRRNEAERRLQSAEENLLRLRDIVDEIRQRVEPLSEQAEKAKTYLAYAEEKKQLEIALWLRSIEQSRDTLRKLSGKLELFRTEYDKASDAVQQIETQAENAAKTAENLLLQVDEIRRKNTENEAQASQAESLAAVRENDRVHYAQTVERLRGDMDRFGVSVQTLDAEEQAIQSEIRKKAAEIAEQETQRLSYAGQIEKISQNLAFFTDKTAQLSRIAAEMTAKAAECRVAVTSSKNALAEISERRQVLNTAYADAVSRKERINGELSENEAARQACRERITNLSRSAESLRIRLEDSQKQTEEARREAGQRQIEAETLRRRIHMLEEMENSLEGFSGSVKAVIRKSKRGELTGIHGAVSQLFQADEKAALAIETALGAMAQYIVCDAQKDAKRAMTYLKHSGEGRATFVPLDTVRSRRLREPDLAKTDGFVGLAGELVQCENRYRVIADNLLGTVAVARDLDSAMAIAKKFSYRFRVVSLDGQVVNAGGSMTGGSPVKNAGLISRHSRMDRLRAESADLAQKERQAQQDWQQAQRRLSETQAEYDRVVSEQTATGENNIRLEAEHRRLSEQFANAEKQENDYLREISGLDIRAREIRKTIDEARTGESEAISARTELEAEMASSSEQSRELMAQRDVLNDRLSGCRLHLAALSAEKDASESSLRELSRRREDTGAEQKRLQEQIDGLNREIEQIGRERRELTENANRLREQAEAGKKRMEELTELRLATEAGQTTLRQQWRDQTHERERIGREITRLEEKIAAEQNQAQEKETRLLEEYRLTRLQAEEQSVPLTDYSAATARLQELKNSIRALGSVNVNAIEEYEQVRKRYEFLTGQVNDVEVSRRELLALIDELTGEMRSLFLERFDRINEQFGAVFSELFDGGSAHLLLTDPEHVLESGIDMQVQPPGKKILHLDALSGGEKALTAIALLFAILRVTPSPFCVLDEIEAALDDVNVERFARYLRRMCSSTQFIVITHRRGTMEAADVLYGVTMQEKGVSKLLELRVGELAEQMGLDE